MQYSAAIMHTLSSQKSTLSIFRLTIKAIPQNEPTFMYNLQWYTVRCTALYSSLDQLSLYLFCDCLLIQFTLEISIACPFDDLKLILICYWQSTGETVQLWQPELKVPARRYTDKKALGEISFIYMESICYISYMRNGFFVYEDLRKQFRSLYTVRLGTRSFPNFPYFSKVYLSQIRSFFLLPFLNIQYLLQIFLTVCNFPATI